MPRGTLDEYNDSPRRQFAAYELQKLFLDPEDYVVPTSLAYCSPLATYPRSGVAPQRPTLPGSTCVLGFLNIWLKDVTISDDYYDEARFVSDPTYAYYLANCHYCLGQTALDALVGQEMEMDNVCIFE